MVQIKVLDKGYVELQSMMGDDLSIVNAARTSYLGESKGEEQDKKLLFYLMKHKHHTPFEMVEFKFRIKAPLVTWWQLVRHRTFSLNMQSGRYTVYNDEDFYVPDKWRKQSESNKQASEGFIADGDSKYLFEKLTDHYDYSYILYNDALNRGVSRELARLFLPGFAVYYTGIVKCDARNLMHFLGLRMASEAQYEIQVYAQTIYDHFFKPLLPWTAEAYELYGGI